ncbi:MAG: hypothetical protein ABI693_33550 [Bryobacteraceae bacterium]
MNRKILLIVLVAAVAFVAIIYTSMRDLRNNRVEVCITFNGRQACRVASGPSQAEATRTASDNACALIASGVTETMACGRTQPDSVKPLN